MTLFPQPVPAELSGAIDGRALAGRGSVAMGEDGISLRCTAPGAQGDVRLSLASIAGVVTEPRQVTLATMRGTVMLAGDERIVSLGHELESRLFQLPEMTRALRSLGSRRGSNPDGVAHAMYFAPLLAARREAGERASAGKAPLDVAAPLAARALRKAVAEGRHALASHHPEGPVRRAMSARLIEACEPLDAAIETLRIAEEALAAAGPLERAAAWRKWSGAVAQVFEMADRCWPAVDETFAQRLEAPVPQRTPWWRRSRGGEA